MSTRPITSSVAWPPPQSAGWPEEDRRRLVELKPELLPRHVAVIMDGNGRWARQRGWLERVRGHEAGVDSVRETVRACGVVGVEVLTLYSFSSENWSRPRAEVSALMMLLERFLVNERPELMDNNVRLLTIGRTADLPEAVRKRLAETIDLTAQNTGLKLVLALSYGSRDEMLRAIRAIARDAKAGEIDPDAIEAADLETRLDTAGLPDPDLLIRTSGEQRISNFLLWQIAYSEIYITPTLWPDFRRPHLLDALVAFQGRDRRFGGLGGTQPRAEAPTPS